MTDEDLIDELSEAIYDSLDMDWLTEDGARLCLPIVRRLEVAAREEGRRAGLEEAATIAAHHASARRKAQDAAKMRRAKAEARDYESMAIEAVQIECAIRAKQAAKPTGSALPIAVVNPIHSGGNP